MQATRSSGNRLRDGGSKLSPFGWQELDSSPGARPAVEERPLGTPLRGYGLEQVMAEAEQIIAQAEADAERLRSEAAAGLEAQRERLRAEVRAEVAAELAATSVDQAELRWAQELYARGLQEIRERYGQQLEELEQRAVEAALEIARRVIGSELQSRPELVLDSVREALALAGTGELTVHVHPADLPYLQPALLELQRFRTGDDFITFDEDPTVERGGCRVSGPNGTIDTQPSSKLSQFQSLAD